MILNGFKEKSNQKFINKLIDSRRVESSLKKVEFIGVILNLDEFDDFEAFRNLFSKLKLNPNNVKIAAFTGDSKLVESSRELLFSKKEIGWKGKIKSNELDTFLNTNFDALISYYKQDNLVLNLATAKSKSCFKIGISSVEERLNDLILDVKPKDFNVFKQELIKYLTILKKL